MNGSRKYISFILRQINNDDWKLIGLTLNRKAIGNNGTRKLDGLSINIKLHFVDLDSIMFDYGLINQQDQLLSDYKKPTILGLDSKLYWRIANSKDFQVHESSQ